MLTYEKFLGMINADRAEPVVEADGRAWMTRDGAIALFPDHLLSDGVGLRPLPPGIKAVDHDGNEVVVPRR